jgi:hypothetical protein
MTLHDPHAVPPPSRLKTGQFPALAANGNKEIKRSAPPRLAKSRRMNLTKRDREVVSWVYTVGVARREDVQTLFFGPGGRSRAQHRLTLLFRNGYLDRLPRMGRNSPDVYCLSARNRRGLSLLRSLGVGEPRPARISTTRLKHTIAIASCRAVLTRACREMGVDLVKWLDSTELAELMAATAIVPDAFFQLSRSDTRGEERKSAFFLEVERSDKADRTLLDKFRRLGGFYYGGEFTRRFGLRKAWRTPIGVFIRSAGE